MAWRSLSRKAENMKTYQITTQQEIRRLFRQENPQLSFKKIADYRGKHAAMYPCDTRCAFVDFVDSLARGNQISEALAFRATL